MYLLYASLISKNYKALVILLALFFIWSLCRFILYKRIGLDNCWLAFVPILSYKPMFDLCDISFILMALIVIPGIGHYCYNSLLAYLFYRVCKKLGQGMIFSGVSMVFGYFTISYLALTGNFVIVKDEFIDLTEVDLQESELDKNYENILNH